MEDEVWLLSRNAKKKAPWRFEAKFTVNSAVALHAAERSAAFVCLFWKHSFHYYFRIHADFLTMRSKLTKYGSVTFSMHRPWYCARHTDAFRLEQDILSVIITYLLTYSLEQSPSWGTNRFSASQEITRILWNPKVHYRIHKCSQPVLILSHLDPVHTPTSHFLKIQLNIFLPSTPGSPKWFLSLRFPHPHSLYASPLPHTRYMPRPHHSSRFYHANGIGWAVQIIWILV